MQIPLKETTRKRNPIIMRNKSAKSAALLAALTLTLFLASPASAAKSQPPGKNAILLSNVQALTLRNNRMTTSRRVSPIPQLTCVGNQKICKLHQIEAMRCSNDGFDYDEEDIQWTCTAPLPAEFKLGSTDVICEGYRNSDDPWVLKGSCGVEYRMLLTEQGEERFGMGYGGSGSWPSWTGSKSDSKLGRGWKLFANSLGVLIFWGFFFGVSAIIFWPFLAALFGVRNPRPRDQRRGWGGFWGGGGGGGDDGFYPGPPPPYSYSDCSSSQRPGWTPGFWTGALGGAAAGYRMGRNSERRSNQRNSFTRFNDSGEGSSRSSPQFSTTTTGTGFGSTRRR